MKDYNGWKNYETWNQSLWIRNDEFLYSLAKQCKDFPDFVLRLKDMGIDKTGDNVYWGCKGTSIEEMNEVIKEI